MNELVLDLIGFISLFCALFGSVLIGRYFGRWQIVHNPQRKILIVSVAEGAVFALLGLLIAFTFSGAYERFENRKFYIIDEVNAIAVAYMRVGLLPEERQVDLRNSIRQYVDSRINIYKNLPEFALSSPEFAQAIQLRTQIWNQALYACKAVNDSATTMLLIPALNNMFDIAAKRLAITLIHPPLAIFILLIILAMLSSFLAGFASAKSKIFNYMYILSYVAITTLTIYIIIDLEYPRHGLIKVNKFDQLLVKLRSELN